MTPNSAAAFKVIVLGEVDTWLVNMPSLLQAAAAANMERKRLTVIVELMEQLSSERFHLLVRHGLKVVHKKMMKDTLYYVPGGWLGLEKASWSSSVVYGVRKSYLWATTAAKQAYARAMELSEPSPTIVANIQFCLEFVSA